jgi:hypothetical protein
MGRALLPFIERGREEEWSARESNVVFIGHHYVGFFKEHNGGGMGGRNGSSDFY